MEQSNTRPILVTGATGFVASHIIKQLLEQGYKVRGTVRSLANKEKYKFLYELVPEKKDNIQFVEASLLAPETWIEALEGIDYVMHVASPFPSTNPKDENEVIRPAVEGTLNVLKAAVEKGAKKVVITSSVASILAGNESKVSGPDDWSDETKCIPYQKSKLRAEKAAWDFWSHNKDKIDVVVVNPGLILGPIYTVNGGTCEILISEMMTGKLPATPEVNFPVADVREVAECHIKAMFTPNNAGKRYICAWGSLWVREMANLLRDEFSKYGYSVTKWNMGKWLMTFVGFFDKRISSIIPEAFAERKVDNQMSVKELGISYRDPRVTLTDMGYSLIKAGVVPNKVDDKK